MIALAELTTMYRVMILFMLNRVEYPLTNTQITNLILEKDYTDYFHIQQLLADLLSSELIVAESTHNNTRYRITEAGRETLNYFEEKIPADIKQEIISYLQEHNYDLKQETSVYADCYKSAQGGYAARCRVQNNRTSVIDLTLTVDTKEQAQAICRNWKKESANVYELLMDQLIK